MYIKDSNNIKKAPRQCSSVQHDSGLCSLCNFLNIDWVRVGQNGRE